MNREVAMADAKVNEEFRPLKRTLRAFRSLKRALQ
jgi:hypothetical protein